MLTPFPILDFGFTIDDQSRTKWGISKGISIEISINPAYSPFKF